MTDAMGPLWLQAQAAPLGMDFFFMMGAIFLIFYLLVIRPDSQRRKEHESTQHREHEPLASFRPREK